MAVVAKGAQWVAKPIAHRFAAVMAWLLAARELEARERRSAEFLVASLATGFLAGLITLFSAPAAKRPMLGAWVIATSVLPLLLRTRLSLGAVQCIALIATSLFLIAISLTQPRLYWQQLYWFALLPLCGGLLVQARGVAAGAVTGMLSALFIIWYHWQRGGLDPASTNGTATAVVDITLFLAVMFALTVVYVYLHASAIERAERAANARSAFLAHMSHELRTPMNGVLGVLQLIDTSALTRGVRDQLALVQRSGEAMIAIIDDLLDFTRLEADALQYAREPFSPREVLHDVVALLEPRAQAKQIALECAVAESVPQLLRGDALRVRQVLHNLLANAVKFTADGGVRLEVGWAADQLSIAVEDDGIGIAEDVLASLFQPFRQADASTAKRFGGSGLGLAIARGLARGMGGDIAASSTLGRGSRFVFSCKATAVDPATLPSGAGQRFHRDYGSAMPLNGRVLIVDDNEINCIVSRRMCERAGLDVSLVFDGAAALDALMREHFDLVLMDVHMPVMDGFEATRRIRAMSGRRAAVPIVAVTASAMPDELERCRASGMNDVVAKPLDSRLLTDVLARHLRATGEARYLH